MTLEVVDSGAEESSQNGLQRVLSDQERSNNGLVNNEKDKDKESPNNFPSYFDFGAGGNLARTTTSPTSPGTQPPGYDTSMMRARALSNATHQRQRTHGRDEDLMYADVLRSMG